MILTPDLLRNEYSQSILVINIDLEENSFTKLTCYKSSNSRYKKDKLAWDRGSLRAL